MSLMDDHGNLHDTRGRFAAQHLTEADSWLPADQGMQPLQRFEELDAPTKMMLRNASVSLPATLMSQVVRSMRAEGYLTDAVDPTLVRALQYAEFAWQHRHLVGLVPGWGVAEYREMGRPWREHVGELHPDDVLGEPDFPDVLDGVPHLDDLDDVDPPGDDFWAAADTARQQASASLGRFLPEDPVDPPY